MVTEKKAPIQCVTSAVVYVSACTNTHSHKHVCETEKQIFSNVCGMAANNVGFCTDHPQSHVGMVEHQSSQQKGRMGRKSEIYSY